MIRIVTQNSFQRISVIFCLLDVLKILAGFRGKHAEKLKYELKFYL